MHEALLQMRICSPTYNISVLAGNLGRISMSKQEMVRDLHSEHSQTAGQESAASEEPLTGRMTSVNSAHVIICMLLLRGTAAKYPQNEPVSPPDVSLWCPPQAVCDQFDQGTLDQRCLFWGGEVLSSGRRRRVPPALCCTRPREHVKVGMLQDGHSQPCGGFGGGLQPEKWVDSCDIDTKLFYYCLSSPFAKAHYSGLYYSMKYLSPDNFS